MEAMNTWRTTSNGWDAKVVNYILRCSCDSALEIFERLFERRLLKRIHRRGINAREMEDIDLRSKFLDMAPTDCYEFERNISSVNELNCNSDHVILNIITIKNPTYRSPAGRISEDEIQVKLDRGTTMYLKEIEWSVMNLANVEDKQQYVEVYAPGENWIMLPDPDKKQLLEKLDTEAEKILYEN